jgi:anti-anti-sigma factor
MTISNIAQFRDENDTIHEETAGVFVDDDTDPRAAIVHVFGEATFADADALAAMILSVIRIGRTVVIDMLECTYMDCATIGVLVRAAKNLGERLRLVMPRRSQSYRMLDLTGLARVLYVFESIDEAVAPLGAAVPAVRLRSV